MYESLLWCNHERKLTRHPVKSVPHLHASSPYRKYRGRLIQYKWLDGLVQLVHAYLSHVDVDVDPFAVWNTISSSPCIISTPRLFALARPMRSCPVSINHFALLLIYVDMANTFFGRPCCLFQSDHTQTRWCSPWSPGSSVFDIRRPPPLPVSLLLSMVVGLDMLIIIDDRCP